MTKTRTNEREQDREILFHDRGRQSEDPDR